MWRVGYRLAAKLMTEGSMHRGEEYWSVTRIERREKMVVLTTAIRCILLREEMYSACSLVVIHKVIRNVHKGRFSSFWISPSPSILSLVVGSWYRSLISDFSFFPNDARDDRYKGILLEPNCFFLSHAISYREVSSIRHRNRSPWTLVE